MPGKVNPVIPEVVNQVAFRVIGNDLTITIASEAGQLELNVMEPIIVYSLFENIEMLIRSMNTLRDRCVTGITANEETCRRMVRNSIGVVTALNPYLGYETSTELAKTALRTGKGIYDLVLEQGLMSREELDSVLSPENMLRPHKLAATVGRATKTARESRPAGGFPRLFRGRVPTLRTQKTTFRGNMPADRFV